MPEARRVWVAPLWDRPAAVTSLAIAAPFLLILFVMSRLNVRAPACPQDPACDQLMMSIGAEMLTWLPPLIYVVALVITIGLWKRRMPVFWVALVAMILVVVVFIIANLLMSWAW